MKETPSTIPSEKIEQTILLIRGHKIMLDTDLAKLYQVRTFRLNEAVKRNACRFPEDFMFQLTEIEKREVIANCDHLGNLKFSPQLPYAFTEQGIAMLSSVLRSARAIRVNIEIMRTFVRLKKWLASHAALASKIDGLEKKYGQQFKIVFDTLRKMLTPPSPPALPPKPKGPIGFQPHKP